MPFWSSGGPSRNDHLVITWVSPGVCRTFTFDRYVIDGKGKCPLRATPPETIRWPRKR